MSDRLAEIGGYSGELVPRVALARGDLFGARYELLEQVGRGGSAVVWQVRDRVLARDVAIKVAQPRNEKSRLRLVREAQIGAQLGHPSLMPVLDFGGENGCVYIIMPLVAGPTLRARVNGGRLPWRTVAVWIHHLLAGLGLLHAAGYIHRDVKSENCLISTDASGDRLILADFGLARTIDPCGTSEVIGSINYMAPERVTDVDVDARSDLYSVGVVLFEALTRRLPFPGAGQDDVIRLHAHEPPPRVSSLVDVPDVFDEIVATALAKKPKDRFQSAAEFDEAMLRLIDDRELDAVPVAGSWEVLRAIEAWLESRGDSALEAAKQAARRDKRWGSLQTLFEVASLAEDSGRL